MAYRINFTADDPEVSTEGRRGEVRLQTVVSKVEGGQTTAADGVVKFLRNDETIAEIPVNEDGMAIHRLDISLQPNPQTIRFGATFRSPSGEVALAQPIRKTIPPAPRERQRRDEPEWRYKLVLQANRAELPQEQFQFVLHARLTRMMRRGDETREIPVSNREVVFFATGTEVTTRQTTTATGDAFLTLGPYETVESEQPFIFTAQARSEREIIATSNSVTQVLPAKKVKEEPRRTLKLDLEVQEREVAVNRYCYLLKAKLSQVEGMVEKTLPSHLVRFFLTSNGEERALTGTRPPSTDANGVVLLRTAVIVAGEYEEFFYFQARAQIETETVASETIIKKHPAVKKAERHTVATLNVKCEGNVAQVIAKDKGGNLCPTDLLRIILHASDVVIRTPTPNGKKIACRPISLPDGTGTFCFFSPHATSFRATFVCGEITQTKTIYT